MSCWMLRPTQPRTNNGGKQTRQLPATTAMASVSPAQHTQQQRCQGLLLFRKLQEQQGLVPQYEATCFGRSTVLPGEEMDLWEYSREERPGIELGGDEFEALACVGSSVYQHNTGSSSSQVPPPFCRGLELLQYAAAAHHAQQGHRHPAMFSEQHAAASTASAAAAHPMAPHPASNTSTASTAAPEPSPAHTTTTSSSCSSSSSRVGDGEGLPDLPPRPLLGRLIQVSQDVAERLEGQDPWWFAKAFAHRAELNLSAMAEFGRQLWTHAAGQVPADEDQDMDQ